MKKAFTIDPTSIAYIVLLNANQEGSKMIECSTSSFTVTNNKNKYFHNSNLLTVSKFKLPLQTV